MSSLGCYTVPLGCCTVLYCARVCSVIQAVEEHFWKLDASSWLSSCESLYMAHHDDVTGAGAGDGPGAGAGAGVGTGAGTGAGDGSGAGTRACAGAGT